MVRIEIDCFFVFVFVEAKKVTIVTDSIAKYVSGIDGVVVHPSVHILISAILPRPIDHTDTDDFIRSVNGHLDKSMSKPLIFRFMKTYRPFMFGGKVRRELFAHRDGGLHLNIAGTEKLRYYF